MKNMIVSYNCNEIRVILYQHLKGANMYPEKVDQLARIIKSLSPENQASLSLALSLISDGRETKGI